MADKEIGIVIKAVDQATATIKKVGGSLSSRAEKNTAKFQKMTVAGTAVFGALTVAVGGMIKEFQEAEKASARLDQIATQVTKATKTEIQGFKDLAVELQKKGVIEADAIIQGQSQIASFTKNSKVVTELTDDLADLAVAQYGTNVSGEQMQQTANLVGKALGGQMGALTKTGILVSDEYAKAFEKANNEHDRAIILSKIIQDNYGGLNEAMRKTSAGGLQALSNSFGDLKEAIGGAFAPILDRIVKALVPIIDKLSDWATNNPKIASGILIVVGALAALVAGIGALGLAIPSIIKGFNGLVTIIGGASKALIFLATNPVGWVILAIGALIAIGVLLYKNRDTIKAKAIEVGTAISTAWTNVKNWFNGFVSEASSWGSNLIDMIVLGIKNKYNEVKDAVMGMATIIKDYLGFGSPTKEGPNSNSDKWIPNLVNMMVQGFDNGNTKIQSAVNRIAGSIAGSMKKGFDVEKLKGYITSMQGTAVSLFDSLASKISQHKANVQSMAGEYKQLQSQLKDINAQISGIQSEGSASIAQRAVDIEAEKADIQKQIAEGSKSMTEQEKSELDLKLQKLEAEYLLATSNASQAEIAEARRQSTISETQKIIEQTAEKVRQAEIEKSNIIQQMELKKKMMLDEIKTYIALDKQKTELDKIYFKTFQTHIQTAQDSILQTIAKMKELISLQNAVSSGSSSSKTSGKRAFGGTVQAGKSYLVGESGPEMFTPATTGSINTNAGSSNVSIAINMGGVVVQNDADENRLIDKLKNSIAREMQLYKLGIN